MTDPEGSPQPHPDPATISLGGSPNRRRTERLPRTSLFVAVVLVGVITIITIVLIGVILYKSTDTGKQSPDALNGLVALAGGGLGSLGTFLARGQGNT